MKLIFFAAFIVCSAAAQAETRYVLQAGKTFLDPKLEKQAAELNQDPDKTRKLAMKEIEIQKGDAVIFMNRDLVAHNIVSEKANFDLKIQERGTETAPQTFNESGEFTVHCMIHPKMKLLVKVK